MIRRIRRNIKERGLLSFILFVILHKFRQYKLRLKSFYYTKRYVDGSGKIIFKQSGIGLKIKKDYTGKLNLVGDLIIEGQNNMPGYVSIIIAARGIIHILEDFTLGENIKISVARDAILNIGGKKNESASGITSNSIIACNKEIIIGSDLICSWNVFITDCNWHTIYINGVKKDDTIPVKIGAHNWIGSNVIIGPGTILGDNCIVGAFTKLSNATYPSNSTIGGIVPKIITSDLSWARDI